MSARAIDQPDVREIAPDPLGEQVLQPVGDHNLALLAAYRRIERLDGLNDAVGVFGANASKHYCNPGHACLLEIGAAAVRGANRVEA